MHEREIFPILTFEHSSSISMSSSHFELAECMYVCVYLCRQIFLALERAKVVLFSKLQKEFNFVSKRNNKRVSLSRQLTNNKLEKKRKRIHTSNQINNTNHPSVNIYNIYYPIFSCLCKYT